jgi:hypothetical protein
MKSGHKYSSRRNVELRRRLCKPRHIQPGRSIPYYQTSRDTERNYVDCRMSVDWFDGED